MRCAGIWIYVALLYNLCLSLCHVAQYQYQSIDIQQSMDIQQGVKLLQVLQVKAATSIYRLLNLIFESASCKC